MNYQQSKVILDATKDLDDLEELVNKKPVSRKIGDIATKLHKLINEHSLQRCWTYMGFSESPRLNVNTLSIGSFDGYSDPNIRGLKDKFVVIAPIFGMTGGILIYDVNTNRQFTTKIEGPIFHTLEQRFRISKFADSSGMYARGTYIKRQSAINFMRNKRGGAHALDWNLDEKDQKRSYGIMAQTYDPQPIELGGEIQLYQVLNGNLNQFESHLWNIATDLVYSEDTQTLMEKVKERFPWKFS